MKKILLATVLSTTMLFSLASHAGGGGMTGGATEVTQLLNNVQLVQQYATQMQQYETQLKNLMKQTDAGIINPAAFIGKVANVVEQGEALGFASARIATNLEKAYGSDYLKNSKYVGKDFEVWMKTTKDSIRGAMRSVGVQQGALESEADAILKLQKMSGSAEGNLQVLQTGNQISLEMIQQLQKLRTMNMAQGQAINARMLAVQNKEENQKAQVDKFFNKKQKTYEKM